MRDLDASVTQEADRLLRPWGGVRCWGRSSSLESVVRGALEGAGHWTHQYADAANTVNSGDVLRARSGRHAVVPRRTDFDVPSRHGRGPAPLTSQWRVFHEGLDGIVAVNAYNGRELWRYPIPNVLRAYHGDELMGVSGTGSNMCLGGDRLYVATEHRCLQLDVATGQLLGEYATAPEAGGQQKPWGYLAWSDGLLFGSIGQSGARRDLSLCGSRRGYDAAVDRVDEVCLRSTRRRVRHCGPTQRAIRCGTTRSPPSPVRCC